MFRRSNHSFMSPLHHLKLRIFVTFQRFDARIWWIFCTMQHQTPFLYPTILRPFALKIKTLIWKPFFCLTRYVLIVNPTNGVWNPGQAPYPIRSYKFHLKKSSTLINISSKIEVKFKYVLLYTVMDYDSKLNRCCSGHHSRGQMTSFPLYRHACIL